MRSIVKDFAITLASLTSLLVLALSSPTVNAASFDCKAATTSTEKMICKDENLSALDDQMAKAYAHALVATEDPNALKKEQRNWVRNDRAACKTSACLRGVYAGRLRNLKLWEKSIYPTHASGQTDDNAILGRWESYSRTSGIIGISSLALKHEACHAKFKLISGGNKEYLYKSEKLNSCFPFYLDPLNYIKVIYEEKDVIDVRYYSSASEASLQGIETYSRIKER